MELDEYSNENLDSERARIDALAPELFIGGANIVNDKVQRQKQIEAYKEIKY